MALMLATQILQGDSSGRALVPLSDVLHKVTRLNPALSKLASEFSEAVTRHGYRGREAIRACCDECLMLAFDHTGDGIDLKTDLVVPNVSEPEFDKWPQWLAGASLECKREVGRVMATAGIPTTARLIISDLTPSSCSISFEVGDGSVRGPWRLEHSQAYASRLNTIEQINLLNKQNQGRHMNLQATFGQVILSTILKNALTCYKLGVCLDYSSDAVTWIGVSSVSTEHVIERQRAAYDGSTRVSICRCIQGLALFGDCECG